jgi:hypothetical protein
MYVYTEKDLENIRKEVLEDVQDITSLAVNPGSGFVAWYPTLAGLLKSKLENVDHVQWTTEEDGHSTIKSVAPFPQVVTSKHVTIRFQFSDEEYLKTRKLGIKKKLYNVVSALDDAFNKSFFLSAYSFKAAMEDRWRGGHSVFGQHTSIRNYVFNTWIVEIVDHMMGIEQWKHLGGDTLPQRISTKGTRWPISAHDRLGIDLDKDGKFPDGSSTNALHSQIVP